eukprot:TRINITY_DN5322_c0_g2_i1.p1 TRINITY_DN5322_c0_g2~~TRINITY_DN5322_c0_g2_i1.p1  ORF type:complete len:105 (-),score=9.32 TRINITY_DN5322_c0_g2_i1:401-715(-)
MECQKGDICQRNKLSVMFFMSTPALLLCHILFLFSFLLFLFSSSFSPSFKFHRSNTIVYNRESMMANFRLSEIRDYFVVFRTTCGCDVLRGSPFQNIDSPYFVS